MRGASRRFFGIVLLVALLLPASSGGADFNRHLDWARAAASADIFELRSGVRSPMGVPLSQWSHGPGLLLALGGLAFDVETRLRAYLGGLKSAMEPGRLGAHLIGWAAALVFWWAMLGLLRRAARGDGALVMLGAGILFLGTHAGYYSHAHGSETFAYAVGAVLALHLTAGREAEWLDGLWIGSAIGLLVLIRPHLAIYGVPALVMTCVRLLRAPATHGKPLALLLLFFPIVIAGLQVALTNRWMTGSPLRLPHVFGSGAFQSLDWAQPELFAVLLHPWHGLLVYHPLYALGAVALATLALRTASRTERLVGVAIGAIILIHLYIQAAWYVWWLGFGAFGMRGMAIAAVVLVPVLIRATVDARTPWGRRAWILLALGASLWSYLLLLRGPTQFFSYADVLRAQGTALPELFGATRLLALTLGLLVALLFVRRALVRSRAAPRDRLVEGGAILLGVLSLAYLVERVVYLVDRFGLPAASLVLWGGVALLLVALFPSLSRDPLPRPFWGSDGARTEALAGWGVVTVFAVMLLLFARLAVHTEQRIAAGIEPDRLFAYSSAVHLEEVRHSYREYLLVPGFTAKKAALLEFLEAHGVDL